MGRAKEGPSFAQSLSSCPAAGTCYVAFQNSTSLRCSIWKWRCTVVYQEGQEWRRSEEVLGPLNHQLPCFKPLPSHEACRAAQSMGSGSERLFTFD